MIRALVSAVAIVAIGVSEARAGSCTEVSPIVGRRHCGYFGQGWAYDPWILNIEGALAFTHLALGAMGQDATAQNANGAAPYHAQIAVGQRHAMDTLGPRFWFGYRYTHLDVGVEATFGRTVDGPRSVTQVEGFAPITSTSGNATDVGGRLGVHTRVGDFALGAAVLIGARGLSLPQYLPAGYTTCDRAATGNDCSLALQRTELLVESRICAERWLTPHLTLGVTAGFDAIGGGESVALTLAVHGNSFDGS